MSRKDVLNNLFTAKLGTPNRTDSGRRAPNDTVRTGAVSAMSSVLNVMADGAKAAEELREQLAAGATVIEVNPSLIDGSMIADRLVQEVDPAFDALVDSIRTNGQEIPILVRPNPAAPGRYQIAYGRRRVRATRKLGISVRALVKQLTDEQLVIAQGTENLIRQDLSFIEKALFAQRLEDAGYGRSTIMAALSTDKGDLSRYISVARMLPEKFVEAIGPAPKAGRARWLALAERLEKTSAVSIAEQILTAPQFIKADSDGRFRVMLEALRVDAPRRRAGVRVWTSPQGKKAARIERGNGRTVISFEEKLVPDFAAYLERRLDELYQEFVNHKEEKREDQT